MLKINNQDDCCLYNNVFNYQYGFPSPQFVPALLWMETPLLSNGNHVSTLQLHFRAINSINLADPGDKAAKKETKKKQAERNKGGNVRPQTGKTNQGKENRQVVSKPAQAPVHYHSMWADPWDTEQPPWASKELPPSLSSPFTGWDTQKKAGSAPQELVRELEDNLALSTCRAGASLKPPVPAEYPAGFVFTSLLNM